MDRRFTWGKSYSVTIKVAHLTSAHPAFDIRIFHKECRSIVQAGYDVTLIAPHVRSEVVEGVRIEPVRRAGSRLLRMIGTVGKVLWKALRLNADVYHFHDPELIPAGLLLRAFGKRVIYDVHEDVPRDILSKAYLPVWLRQPLSSFIELLERVACRRFSGLVTVTPTIEQRLRSYQKNTVLVRNFPRLEEFLDSDRPWTARQSAIAYVGVIHNDRGIREMVRAMGMLPELLDARLLLASNAFPKDIEEELALDPGWSRIDNRGRLTRGEIVALLAQARAGLVLFHPEPNHVPAMPHKLFEYMAAGIPVIASNFPAWREIILENRCGILVNPLDTAAIAEAIEFILTHAQEAEQMGLRGRLAAKAKYSWQTEEQQLLEFYSGFQQRTESRKIMVQTPSEHRAL